MTSIEHDDVVRAECRALAGVGDRARHHGLDVMLAETLSQDSGEITIILDD